VAAFDGRTEDCVKHEESFDSLANQHAFIHTCSLSRGSPSDLKSNNRKLSKFRAEDRLIRKASHLRDFAKRQGELPSTILTTSLIRVLQSSVYGPDISGERSGLQRSDFFQPQKGFPEKSLSKIREPDLPRGLHLTPFVKGLEN
jgi:hypothetical protein